jgi:hypothetical protein
MREKKSTKKTKARGQHTGPGLLTKGEPGEHEQEGTKEKAREKPDLFTYNHRRLPVGHHRKTVRIALEALGRRRSIELKPVSLGDRNLIVCWLRVSQSRVEPIGFRFFILSHFDGLTTGGRGGSGSRTSSSRSTTTTTSCRSTTPTRASSTRGSCGWSTTSCSGSITIDVIRLTRVLARFRSAGAGNHLATNIALGFQQKLLACQSRSSCGRVR